jgi:hypothetical protein
VIGNSNEIDLNSVNVATTGAATLHLFLEDTGFASPKSPPATILGTVGGTLNAPAGSTITVQSWANAGNAVPNYGPNTFPAGPVTIGGVPSGSVASWSPAFVSGPGAFSSTSSSPFNVSGPYSLFAEVDVTFSGAGSVSFNEHQLVTVPEPRTIFIAVIGLLLFGVRYRLRRPSVGATP